MCLPTANTLYSFTNINVQSCVNKRVISNFMKTIYLLILILYVPRLLKAQRGTYSKDELANSILDLRRDTIINGKLTYVTGTGTFIVKDETPYIVTANHVAKEINEKGYVIIKGNNDNPIRLNIVSLVGQKTINWKIHPKADVAILKLNSEKWIVDSGYLEKRFLPNTIFYDTLKSVSRETALTVFGFPLGLGTEGFFSPLTYRTFFSSGLITLPRFDNKKLSTFILLENPSTGGYSGGPVFEMGIIETANVRMSTGRGTICYGIIHGTISDETGGKIAAITPSFYISELFK